MSFDLSLVFALLVAGLSTAVSAFYHGNSASVWVGGIALLFPLAVITWPETLGHAFHHSRDGFSHGGEGPAPASLIRVGGWVLLLVGIAVHHYLLFNGITGHPVR